MADETETKTISVNGISYYPMAIPDRKRIALVRLVRDDGPCRLTPVAYFTEKEEAEAFGEWLAGLIAVLPDLPRL